MPSKLQALMVIKVAGSNSGGTKPYCGKVRLICCKASEKSVRESTARTIDLKEAAVRKLHDVCFVDCSHFLPVVQIREPKCILGNPAASKHVHSTCCSNLDKQGQEQSSLQKDPVLCILIRAPIGVGKESLVENSAKHKNTKHMTRGRGPSKICRRLMCLAKCLSVYYGTETAQARGPQIINGRKTDNNASDKFLVVQSQLSKLYVTTHFISGPVS